MLRKLFLVWRALHLFTLPTKKISIDGRQLLFKVKLSRSTQMVWRWELYVDRGRQVLIYVWNSWVNNKTVNELGFLMFWTIVQISESVTRLGPQPRRISDPPSLLDLHNSSYHTKAEPIIAIIIQKSMSSYSSSLICSGRLIRCLLTLIS